MRIRTGFFVGAVLALAPFMVTGCDDQDSGGQNAKRETRASGDGAATAAGWTAVADKRISLWAFTRVTPSVGGGQPVATEAGPAPAPAAPEPAPNDPLAGIRAAVNANMLPSRASVRTGDLVNRALRSAEPADPASQPTVVLATTPWSDDTLLLWVAVPGVVSADGTTISVEFDPGTVATFRALGDPSSLPAPDGVSGRPATLYEVSPQPDNAQSKPNGGPANLKYGVLHITSRGADLAQRKVDRPITAADAVGAIDNAPAAVQFAAAVAGFAGLLQGDPALRDLSCNDVMALAEGAAEPDPDGWRAQLIALMHRAEPLIDLPPPDTPPTEDSPK